MKQKKDPKKPKHANTGNRPYEKTSGKSPSDPATNEKKPAGETSSSPTKWEYPEESAQVKNNPVANKNAGGYKPDNLNKGNSAPDDEDEDYNNDIRENEYLDDDDEEF